MSRKNWKQCAYCAQQVRKAEREHVFPRSWYPAGCRTERVFAPACSSCNREYGRIEDRLFFPLVACLPTNEDTSDLLDRAMDGFDPTQGDSVRDVSYRRARRARIDRELSVATAGQAINAIWTPLPVRLNELTTMSGLHLTGAPTVRFRPDDMPALATKLVRGCFYASAGRPLPANVPIRAGAFTGNPREIFDEAIERGMQPQGDYPFRFGFIKIDDVSGMWLFTLWDYIALHGMTGRLVEVTRKANPDEPEAPHTVVVGLDA